MFEVFCAFLILLAIISIGIFIVRIVDKKNMKVVREQIKLESEREREREEQHERYRADAQRRLAKMREEQIAKGMHIPVSNDPELNKLIEHGWKIRFKDYKGSEEQEAKQETKPKLAKQETETELTRQERFEKEVFAQLDHDSDKILYNASIRQLYYEIKDILLESDTIEIRSTNKDLDYLCMQCGDTLTAIVKLDGFKYMLMNVQSYNYRDQKKAEVDERAFSIFKNLKAGHSFTDKYPLSIKTKDSNDNYEIELRLTIEAFSPANVQEVWDDFNSFSSQFITLLSTK